MGACARSGSERGPRLSPPSGPLDRLGQGGRRQVAEVRPIELETDVPAMAHSARDGAPEENTPAGDNEGTGA